MRIDKARHREISSRQLQLQVNNLARQGLSKEAIEQALERSQTVIKVNYEEIQCILPRIAVEASNLRRGFIPFFICTSCRSKVRTVYFLEMRIACRICHGLTYKKQESISPIVKRLVWDYGLANSYMATGKLRYISKVMEATFAREELERRGYKIAQTIISKIK